MNRIYLNKKDLDKINQIVNEDKVDLFCLIVDSSSGIGSTIDLEYKSMINNREVFVTVPVSGVDDW
jgi:hypothetical protein